MAKEMTKRKYRVYQIINVILFYLMLAGLLAMRFVPFMDVTYEEEVISFIQLPFVYNLDTVFLGITFVLFTLFLIFRRNYLLYLSLISTFIGGLSFTFTLLLAQSLPIGNTILLILLYLLFYTMNFTPKIWLDHERIFTLAD